MGGTVALQFALTNPDRITRVAIVGSPILGTKMNFFLQLAGYGIIADMVWRFPALLKAVMHLLLAGDSEKVRKMIFRDVQRATLESFFRSIGDLRDTDLREDLPALTIPALGIYGVHDNIVSPSNAELLSETVETSTVQMMQESRHFPMTDEPDKFLRVMTHFLNDTDGLS